MGWFKIIDDLEDAKKVINRDRRMVTQFEDAQQIRSQQNTIILLVVIIIGGIIVLTLPKAGEIQQKQKENHEKSIRDTIPNVDGIEI